MKLKKVILITAAATVASLSGVCAQDDPPPTRPERAPGAERPPRGERPPGGGSRGERPRFVPPIVAALDLDKDGTISAEEIAKASASLKALDKNKDGKLTGDELRPPRPERGGRPAGGGGGERPARGGTDRPRPDAGGESGGARRRPQLEKEGE